MSFDLANFSKNGEAMATFAPSDLSSGSYLFTLQLEESERVSNNASVAVEIVDEALPESKITYVSAGKVSAVPIFDSSLRCSYQLALNTL